MCQQYEHELNYSFLQFTLPKSTILYSIDKIADVLIVLLIV